MFASAYEGSLLSDEAKIGRCPWTDIVNGEMVCTPIRYILRREEEKALDEAIEAGFEEDLEE